MSLFINTIKESEIINSYNFARNSDLVFSEIISKDNYKKLDNKNHNIIFEDKDKIFYKASFLKVKSGDTIFSNTYFVEPLLEKIRETSLEDIKIITSQTDIPITNRLYSKKPKNIAKWFSINVDIDRDDLIPIPYGLANSYSPKNLFKTHFENLSNLNKQENIYMNFEINTNYFHRYKSYKKLRNKKNFLVERKKLDLDTYSRNLNLYKYIYCPWGNGFDTHRLWEALYSGAIAIVPRHKTFSTTKDLPVIQYDNLNELSFEYLSIKQKELQYDYKKLSIDYWMKDIKYKNQKTFKPNEILIKFDDELDIKNYKKRVKAEKKSKNISTNLRKVHSSLFKLNLNKLNTY